MLPPSSSSSPRSPLKRHKRNHSLPLTITSQRKQVPSPLIIPSNDIINVFNSCDNLLTETPISPYSDVSTFSYESQSSIAIGSDSSYGVLESIWQRMSEETLQDNHRHKECSEDPIGHSTPLTSSMDSTDCGNVPNSTYDPVSPIPKQISTFGVGQVLPVQIGIKKDHVPHTIIGTITLGIQPDEEDHSLAVSVMSTILDDVISSTTPSDPQSPLSPNFSSDFSRQSPKKALYRKEEKKCWIVTARYMVDRNDKKVKRQSSKKHRTTKSPVFNEIFSFQINAIAGVLEIILWTEQRFLSHRKKIGTVYVSLDKIKFTEYENYEVISSYRLLQHS